GALARALLADAGERARPGAGARRAHGRGARRGRLRRGDDRAAPAGRCARMTKPDLDPRLAPEPAPLPYARATLGELLRHQAARFGDRVALVQESARITYAELERRSAALARGLVASGVGKGSRVALLAPNGIEFAVSFFGIARAGAIAVGINTFYKER